VPHPRYLDSAFPSTNSIDNPARFSDYFPYIGITKFRHNAERVLTRDKIEKAVEAFTNLEKVGNVNEAMEYMAVL